MSTPDPTLTDEELAEIEADYDAAVAAFGAQLGAVECTNRSNRAANHLPRLIAALRASRQREAVLTAKVASERRMYDIAKARADAAEQASADSVEGFAPGWCCPKDYCGVQFVGDEPCPEGW